MTKFRVRQARFKVCFKLTQLGVASLDPVAFEVLIEGLSRGMAFLRLATLAAKATALSFLSMTLLLSGLAALSLLLSALAGTLLSEICG